jgi:uncharacterized protein (TIGR04255 family)
MSEFSLTNPPLICVAARVQFMPVESMASYIPALQEAFRLKGYPHYQELRTKTWRIDQKGEVGKNVSYEEIPRWIFANIDKTVAIRVDCECVTLFFADYHHFAVARPFYLEILEIIEKAIPALSLVLLQLRYINHIPVKEEEDPSDWVMPSLLGVHVIGDLIRQGSVSETGFVTPEGGSLVVRCASLGQGLTLPPDLLPLDIKLKCGLRTDYSFLLLDNVHTRKAKTLAFSPESCLQELSDLRQCISIVFQEIVTEKAKQSWQ